MQHNPPKKHSAFSKHKLSFACVSISMYFLCTCQRNVENERKNGEEKYWFFSCFFSSLLFCLRWRYVWDADGEEKFEKHSEKTLNLRVYVQHKIRERFLSLCLWLFSSIFKKILLSNSWQDFWLEFSTRIISVDLPLAEKKW